MKCPKCGYIGLESVEKCRNCGYDFSLVADSPDIDLPLKNDPPLAAPADFEFRTGETPPPFGRSPRTITSSFDLPDLTPLPSERELPLFGPSSPRDSSAPAAVPAGVSAPVAAGAPSAPVSAAPAAAARTTIPADGSRPSVVQAPAAAAAAPPARSAAASPAKSATIGDGRPASATRRPTPPASRLRPSAPAPTPFDFKEVDLALEPERAPVRPTPSRPGTQRSDQPGSLARATAGLVDASILGGLDLAILYFTLRLCRLPFSDITILPIAPFVAFLMMLDGAYLVAFTAFGGQTIGKMAASLKVVSEDGARVVPGQAAVRALGYVVSVLSAGLGFVPGLVGPSRRALHDRLANTRVVSV